MPKEEKGISLTTGSKYRIRSLQSKENALTTEGTFIGYTSVGMDDGICIELGEAHGEDKGITRVLPTHMITSIDILKSIEEEDVKEDKTSVYFS